MLNGNKELKIYHGAIAFALFLVCLILMRLPISTVLGKYASFVGELLFLIIAVGTVIVFRGNLKEVFPVKRPKILTILGGGILLWSINSISTACLMIAMYLAPQQVGEASQQMGGLDLGMGFIISTIFIAVMPAVCEEAMFRGVIQNSLKKIPNKWVVIVIIGVLFGACHGSVLKFLSTGLIGALFAYIVYETGNIVYTVILHFLNNFVAVVLLYVMMALMKVMGSAGEYSQAAESVSLAGIPLMTVAIYVLAVSAAPFAIYIGNYLLHRGVNGVSEKLYTKEKKTTMIVLIIITGAILLCGIMLLFTSFVADVGYMKEMMQYTIRY